MRETRRVAPAQPSESKESVDPNEPRRGYLCIAFQPNLTSVFQMSADTPILEENNPTFNGDLVTREGPITVTSSPYRDGVKDRAAELKCLAEFGGQVNQLVTDHHLRNKVVGLFLICSTNIAYKHPEKNDVELFDPVDVLSRLGAVVEERVGAGHITVEIIMEWKLYTEIAIEPENIKNSQYAIMRCTREITYLDYPKDAVQRNHPQVLNGNVGDMEESFDAFLNNFTFDEEEIKPGCCAPKEIRNDPFTMLVVGIHENDAECKKLMEKEKTGNFFVWKKLKHPAMYNPAVACGVLIFKKRGRDEGQDTSHLEEFTKMVGYYDQPDDDQDANPV